MIFKSLTAKVLLGAGLVSAVGGSAAAITSGVLPMANAATQVSPAAGEPARTPAPQSRRDIVRGVVQSVSAGSMVVETRHRDPGTKAVTKDDVTFVLDQATKVYRWDDRNQQLGLDALKAGERVRVRFTTRGGSKYAHRVVILPEARLGKVDSKGTGQFTMTTRDGKTLTVTVSAGTKYYDLVARRDRKPGSFADMSVGDRVLVLGKMDANGTFDAAGVVYRQPAH